MAKLTELNRKWIVEMYKSGEYTQEYLANASKISQQAVAHIIKIAGERKPRSYKGICLACGSKLRTWNKYPVCGDPICGQAYGEASQCKPQDPIKIVEVNSHFWGTVKEWMEIHFKDAGYIERIKEYSLFNSQREHVGYHWEILKYGLFEFSKKTGQQVLRQTNMKPIWDGVVNEHGERGGYRPALNHGDRVEYRPE